MIRQARPRLGPGMALVIVLVSGALAKEESVELTILQLNDVYEITPLNGGVVAGLRGSRRSARRWSGRIQDTS